MKVLALLAAARAEAVSQLIKLAIKLPKASGWQKDLIEREISDLVKIIEKLDELEA